MAARDVVVRGLIEPVCRNTVVRHLVHFDSADLDLNGNAMHAKKGGMQ